ncbi:MAG: hypothetical protein M1827_001823 [Pycnora praestabilis]|nr:MAG: hypothetical protein M1827_001823 [Pycnora praestabilis]
MLHSAFWAHGASELELPPWWTSTRQGAITEDVLDGRDNSATIPSNVFHNLVLDFLYPTKSLGLIHQKSFSISQARENRRNRRKQAGHTRLYSSSAVEDRQSSEHDYHILSPISLSKGIDSKLRKELLSPYLGPDTYNSLRALLDSDQRNDYEEAWQLYSQSRSASEDAQICIELLDYISTSKRTIDTERSTRLFEAIPPGLRVASVYHHAISAFLRLDDIQAALQVCEEAVSKVQGDFGANILLARLVETRDWQAAVDVWASHRQYHHYKGHAALSLLWDKVDSLPILMNHVLALADHVKDQLDSDTVTSGLWASKVRRFTSIMIGRVLALRDSDLDVLKVLDLFDTLKGLKIMKDGFYEKAIIRLLELREGVVATRLYKDYRQQQGVKPSMRVLRSILRGACKFQSIRTVQATTDDMVTFYDGPDREGYRSIMGMFAAMGDVNNVRRIFDECCSRFAKPINTDMALSLLHVHARRGEVKETESQFRRLSEEFGLEPDVKCWNVLINAYVRIDDTYGALCCFEKLLQQNVKPTEVTFGTMMALYAARGDIDGVEYIFKLMESKGLKKTASMIDYLVLAYLKNDDLSEAEKIVEKALEMDLQGSRTRMWNYLINAYALRRNLEATNRISRRMQDAGVPFDGMTYAALMQTLVILRQTSEAYKILKFVMPRSKVQVTAFHYAVIIGGFTATGELREAFSVYARMKKRNIKPVLSTKIAILRAAAKAKIEDQKPFGITVDQDALEKAEYLLEQNLLDTDAMDIAAKEPVKGVGMQPINEARISANFDLLTFSYGQEGAFQKVKELYDRYFELAAQGRSETDVRPPIKLLTALMVSFLHQKRYSEVTDCWELAKAQAKRQAKRWGAVDTTRRGSVLPSRRYALSLPFLHYMKALAEQNELSQLMQEVHDLRRDGFELDNKNWNAYIQKLALAHDDRVVKAFELCEQHLIGGWQGWARQRRRLGLKAESPVNKSRSLRPGDLFPFYHTLVFLGNAFMAARSKALATADKRQMERLSRIAPRTMEAVRNMPRIDDGLQTDRLRRW